MKFQNSIRYFYNEDYTSAVTLQQIINSSIADIKIDVIYIDSQLYKAPKGQLELWINF